MANKQLKLVRPSLWIKAEFFFHQRGGWWVFHFSKHPSFLFYYFPMIPGKYHAKKWKINFIFFCPWFSLGDTRIVLFPRKNYHEPKHTHDSLNSTHRYHQEKKKLIKTLVNFTPCKSLGSGLYKIRNNHA
jgi:hypothetical protein